MNDSNLPMTKKKVVLYHANGLAEVRDVLVTYSYEDGEYLILWPEKMQLFGTEFIFHREANEPQKRVIYKEVTEAIEDESLEDSVEPEELIEIIQRQEMVIESLAKKVAKTEGKDYNFVILDEMKKQNEVFDEPEKS